MSTWVVFYVPTRQVDGEIIGSVTAPTFLQALLQAQLTFDYNVMVRRQFVIQ